MLVQIVKERQCLKGEVVDDYSSNQKNTARICWYTPY